jgi:hypothetical protein
MIKMAIFEVQPNENVVSVDCAGIFSTMNGKFKVLTIVVKIEKSEQQPAQPEKERAW